jgi:hypothetical protein
MVNKVVFIWFGRVIVFSFFDFSQGSAKPKKALQSLVKVINLEKLSIFVIRALSKFFDVFYFHEQSLK